MIASLMQLYQHGGVTFLAIVTMSVLTVALGLERFFATWTNRRRMRVAAERILAHLAEHDRTMAQAVNASLPMHPATPLFQLLLGEQQPAPGELKRALARVIRNARRRLWMLASLGAIAPFVGLFGTVLGVMESFRYIGERGGGGFSVVSTGISQALVDTAGGIFVGIMAVVLYNAMQVYTGDYVARLKEAAEEVLESAVEVQSGVSRSHAG